MSLLDRLKQALSGRPQPGPDATSGGAPQRIGADPDRTDQVIPPRQDQPPPRTGPLAEAQQGDLIIQRLLRELAFPLAPGRGSEFYASVEQLLQAGRERSAVEVLGRFAATTPEDDELLLRLAELLCRRQEHERALPVLEQLVTLARETGQVPPDRLLRARYLLSEAREARGDAAGARTELELILADDLDYPQTRGRLERLQRTQAAPASGPPSPALPTAAAGRAAQALPTLAGAAGVRHQRYQLLRELGRGSAGTVYLAHDVELGRDLAIKILHPGGKEAGAAARAWNEARLTAAVRHPGVVAVYELDDQRNMVVMELCTGGTLRQRLQAGRLRAGTAIRRTQELLDTLQTVHRTGVVHGDLKPGNLLFRGGPPKDEEERYGDLVIADFGTARLWGKEAGEEGQAAGTLGYLAPERRRDPASLTPAADVYAVGAVLLEMLLGSLPLSRFSLLRGDRLPTTLPAAVTAELGGRAAQVERLLGELLSLEPLSRPEAGVALQAVNDLID